jgi:hypothetical protein
VVCAGCDEDEIATALGYVCHMACMISKWLEVYQTARDMLLGKYDTNRASLGTTTTTTADTTALPDDLHVITLDSQGRNIGS